jgi:peptide/nickel transport system substrate-binding protein
MIAGCSGGDQNTTTTDDGTTSGGDDGTTASDDGGDSGEQLVDKTFTALSAGNPQEVDYNPFTQNTDWHTIGPMSVFPAHYTRQDPTWVPIGFTGWELDGDVFRVQVNDSITWHDGKSFTADDVAFHHKFAKHMGAGKHRAVYDYADSVEATGEYTVEYKLSNSNITENTFLSTSLFEPMYMHPDEWSEYWESFQDATTEDEKQAVREEVLNFRLPDPTTNGPLKLVNRDAQKYTFEVYEDWPWETVQSQFTDATGQDITDWGRPNFKDVHINWAPDHQRMAQEWQGRNISGGITGGDLEEPQLPPNMEFVRVPALYGIGLMWNLWGEDIGDPPGDPAWQKLNVRKALAHIINRESVGVQYQNQETPKSEIQTGMVKAHQDQWLDDELLNQMTVYDHDYDKGAEYLRKAGFTKENGKWFKPNGDRFEVYFNTGACVNYYVRGFEVASSNLNEFGIKTEVNATDCSTFFSKDYPKRGYQMSTPGFWGGANPHPLGAYEFVYERPSYLPEGADADQRTYYMQDTIGSEFEVPPVGEPDSDDRITVNPHSLIEELAGTTDEAAQTEIIEKLAWATNQFVPKIETTEIELTYGINRNGWKYPETDSKALSVNPSSTFWWHLGIVDAKQ